MVIKSDKTLSPFAAPAETRSSLRQALPQILAVCVKNVLLLGFGMTLGFPTILIPSLSGSDPNEAISLGQEAISWIGSINLICVPVGCLLSGAITQPLGRKRAMQLVNLPFLAAWLLFFFSTEVWQVFLALCITGVTGGLLEAPTLTYVAEVTQPSLRGILASTSTIAVISGILMQFLLGSFLQWRTVAAVSFASPIISFILLFFVPESPHWLITKNRFLDARRSLAWLRGWKDLNEIENEFKELTDQISKTSTLQKQNWKLYTKKSFYWPYSLVCFTFFLGHFSGMTTLQTYAVNIFAALQTPINKYRATIFLGTAQVVGCFTSASLIHYVGKRFLNFLSLIGCSICTCVAAYYAYSVGVTSLDSVVDSNSDTHAWIPTTFLIGSAFFTHCGIRLLPWMLIGEVYTTETRATASGFSGAASYIFSFVSNKLFFTMIRFLTLPGTFWVYSLCALIGCIVLYFELPETEGRTLFEIIEHFAGGKKLERRLFFKSKQRSIKGIANAGFKTDDESSYDSKL